MHPSLANKTKFSTPRKNNTAHVTSPLMSGSSQNSNRLSAKINNNSAESIQKDQGMYPIYLSIEIFRS